ncbi:hypothetical protein IW152_003832 [Coemansia sp. BCRC 34962]|nr:hypothetical protein IW152_003832 [Coemansia sp. BCRC 34962]
MGKRILHVTGFSRDTRARELAHAFERFAFVEYEESRDASDAYDRMHDTYVGDRRIGVQWAKRPPARSWRFDGGSDDRTRSNHRSRSRSPSYRSSRRRGGRSRSRDSRSPPRDGRSHRRPSQPRRPPSVSRSPPRHARRRDDSPNPRDRSPRPRRSSYSRSRSPHAKPKDDDDDDAAAAPPMDVDALRPADEPMGAHADGPAADDLED